MQYKRIRGAVHMAPAFWAREEPRLAVARPFLALLAQTGSGTTPLPL